MFIIEILSSISCSDIGSTKGLSSIQITLFWAIDLRLASCISHWDNADFCFFISSERFIDSWSSAISLSALHQFLRSHSSWYFIRSCFNFFILSFAASIIESSTLTLISFLSFSTYFFHSLFSALFFFFSRFFSNLSNFLFNSSSLFTSSSVISTSFIISYNASLIWFEKSLNTSKYSQDSIISSNCSISVLFHLP